MQDLEDGHEAAATFRLRIHVQGQGTAWAHRHSPCECQAAAGLQLSRPPLDLLFRLLWVLGQECCSATKRTSFSCRAFMSRRWSVCRWMKLMRVPAPPCWVPAYPGFPHFTVTFSPTASPSDFKASARCRGNGLTEGCTSFHERIKSDP